MLKVHILTRRRSDMSHEQCVAYWRDVHAPLFASQPDVKRHVRRYIQCLITGDQPAGPNLGDADGIVELWFDNIDGFNAFANSPSYLNVIKQDEERFTDPKKCEYFCFGGTYDHKINSEQKGRRNMKEKQVKLPGPDHPISIQRNPARVEVSAAGRVIADMGNAGSSQNLFQNVR